MSDRFTVAADFLDRRLAKLTTMEALFLRVDSTHELPIVVETESGRVIARFARDGDCASFVSRDRNTLPAPIIAEIERATEEAAAQGSLDIPERPRT